ncbi:MAG: hypothetical protein LUQ12_02590 [Methanoregulaceae archaeon]|nr:hypothetical protein [Methanoregulaceae archaeon]
MKESTIRIIVLIAIILTEALLVVINIPELSLIASVVLLVALLLASGAGSWIGGRLRSSGTLAARDGMPDEEAASRIKERIPPVKEGGVQAEGGPGSGAPSRIWGLLRSRGTQAARGKEKALPVKETVVHAERTVTVSSKGKPRFETFSMMKRGLHLFLVSCLERGKTKGPDTAGAITPEKAGSSGSTSQISFASVEAAAASPVGIKREPNPFSPLVQNTVLDSDFVTAGDGKGGSGAGSDIPFDADLEPAAPEGRPREHPEPAFHEDIPLILDEEDEEDTAGEMPATGQDHPAIIGEEEAEVTIEEELDELEKLELDVVGLETPEVIQGKPAAGGDQSKEASLEKTMRDLDVRDGYMSPFAKDTSGDVDLLSSMKSDMKGKRKVNQSLVRDLKDIPVQVRDIEEDLVAILSNQKKRW